MEKDIWRVVVTQNKEGKMHFDFAIATPQDAELAHAYMIKLRKTACRDQSFQDVLAPMFIEDEQIKFSHPQYETDENKKKLKELTPRIKTEFNKFRHLHPESKSSFDYVISKADLLCTIYEDVDVYKTPINPVERQKVEEIREARFERAKRQGDSYEMGRLRMMREGD